MLLLGRTSILMVGPFGCPFYYFCANLFFADVVLQYPGGCSERLALSKCDGAT